MANENTNTTWSDDLSVGVEAIDDDHRLLLSLMDQLQQAVDGGENRETVGSVLNALIDYTEFHFEREERMMEACDYPDLDDHQEFHAKLRTKAQNIRNAYLLDPDAELGEKVMEFLTGWLRHHIMGTDKAYAPVMAEKAEAVDEADRAFAADLRRQISDGMSPETDVDLS